MPAITPEFMFDLESNMRQVTTNEFSRLASNTWWDKLAKRVPSLSKKERITWLLDSAQIERKSSGQAVFDDLVGKTVEYENEYATAGLLLKKEQLEDLDGNGVKASAHWSRQMGYQAAYWPQVEVAAALRANGTGYDGKALFATDHPVNPFNGGAGTFANLFTGAASGIYPGACPLGDTVTVEVALNNLAKAIAYIASIKMPNGRDPRMLRPAGILCPPRMTARLTQLTNAKTLVQSATSGALTGDVEAVIKNFGIGMPIEAHELGSAFGGSDTSCYLLMDGITTDELGALAYIDREPFGITYHGPMTSAELARKREFQWLEAGRNTVGLGHPYLVFRLDAT